MLHPRRTWLVVAVVASATSALYSAEKTNRADDEGRGAAIQEIFRPFQSDQAALSPDGKHLAIEKREGEKVLLVIVNLEKNQAVELPLTADMATPVSGVEEKVPTRITAIKWPSSTRVVACVRESVLVAVDADGRNFKRLLGARELRFNTDWLRKPLLPTRTFTYDTEFRRMTNVSGRDVMYNVDGSPIDRGYPVPEVTPVGDNVYIVGPTGTPIFSTPTASSENNTIDLFNSVQESGPVASLQPHVLDVLPDDPDHVLIEIRGSVGPTDDVANRGPASIATSVAKVNVHTGKVEDQFDEFSASRVLVDKQGVARAALRHINLDRRYVFAPKAGARFVSLEKNEEQSDLKGLRVTPQTLLGERAVPLGFDYRSELMYYATNVGRDTYAIRAYDVLKKQDTGFVIEHPNFDFINPGDLAPENVLVYDRYRKILAGARLNGTRPETFWLDPQLARLQKSLDAASPGKYVEIIDWDERRSKFLLRVSDQSDPGAFYVFDAAQSRVFEYAKRAPWMSAEKANASKAFSFAAPDGTRLYGYITLPRTVRVQPIPVLVYCHDGPWGRDEAGFDRGAQALATMGFAVVQVNYRGSAGFGRKHLTALKENGETVALQDIMATLDWVQSRPGISKKRVAVLGNGYGGYLAMRAMQDYPDRFRCGVSINAPSDLQQWMKDFEQAYSFAAEVRTSFFPQGWTALRASSPALNGKRFHAPVLIVQGRLDKVVPEQHARELRRAVANDKVQPEYLELSGEGHARWLPGSYVKVFTALEDFFNANIYNFSVDLGEAKEVN